MKMYTVKIYLGPGAVFTFSRDQMWVDAMYALLKHGGHYIHFVDEGKTTVVPVDSILAIEISEQQEGEL